MKTKVLQLCPMPPQVQEVLDERYAMLRLPERSERDAWLDAHAPGIRGIVTGGHLGVRTAMAARLPDLGIVAVFGVGFDRIDLPAMQAAGVRVTNTPDVLTDDVADLAIALMLNVMRRLPAAERHVRDGHWPAGNVPLARRASGLRYGIVGLGRIGQGIADRLAGFGGSIAYTSRAPKETVHAFHADVRSLAVSSDVLFVATSASADTNGLIDREVLTALGPNGVLINIARGSVVDEAALVEALVAHRLGGAGLDVFAEEPNVPDALLSLPHVALAPHAGSATVEARAAMGNLVLENLDAFFARRPLPTAVV